MTTYATGRNYGEPQILAITVLSCDDDELGDAELMFTDDARGIRGIVRVIAFEMKGASADIGRAVLREYDAGRYQPA